MARHSNKKFIGKTIAWIVILQKKRVTNLIMMTLIIIADNAISNVHALSLFA